MYICIYVYMYICIYVYNFKHLCSCGLRSGVRSQKRCHAKDPVDTIGSGLICTKQDASASHPIPGYCHGLSEQDKGL